MSDQEQSVFLIYSSNSTTDHQVQLPDMDAPCIDSSCTRNDKGV